MSHAKAIKATQQAVRQRVMQLLHWNEHQYGEFQMERAYDYLREMIGEDAFGVKELTYSESFWASWRNHWHKRDTGFVASASVLDVAERLRLYRQTHLTGAITFTPHAAIMADAYAKRETAI